MAIALDLQVKVVGRAIHVRRPEWPIGIGGPSPTAHDKIATPRSTRKKSPFVDLIQFPEGRISPTCKKLPLCSAMFSLRSQDGRGAASTETSPWKLQWL